MNWAPRILIFANDNSSIYNFRHELLQRLVSSGHEVTVALPPHERNRAFEDLGCSVLETRLSRFGTNPFAELLTAAGFMRIIRAVRPDVVLTFTMKPNIYGGIAARIRRVPYISAVTGIGAVFQSDGVMRRIITALLKPALRHSSAVYFENADNRAHFERLGIVRGNTRVVPGSGVNLALHGLEPYPDDAGPFRLVIVSRVRKDKGYDELLAAIRQVCAARNDVEFHIVGWYEDDSYQETIREMERNYPLVVHGSVPPERVHELLAQSHALLHASHHEGMANVLLEASATGIPSLASDIPGCREAIDDGVTGLLFPVRNTDALTATIERFLALPWEERRAMGLAGRRKMESEFDRERVVDRYMDGISEAIAARRKRYDTVKRGADIAASALAVVLTLPVQAVIAVLVRSRLGAPVLFHQERPGMDGRPFVMHKFRTMTDERDAEGMPLPDRERLTPLGEFLRRTSLDELPQFANVLRGEMSLVGPRPLLARYNPYFTKEERARFGVRPGITGWAQVNGRNTSSWDERLAADVWYVENRSLRLDIAIIGMTLAKVIRGSDLIVDSQGGEPDLDETRSMERLYDGHTSRGESSGEGMNAT
ncbi:MAG TPA: sugar transferase [Actinomycetaceae bacterium]|nr:sugar transferase [Actinomycetaceae bacterium]